MSMPEKVISVHENHPLVGDTYYTVAVDGVEFFECVSFMDAELLANWITQISVNTNYVRS